VRFDGDEGAEQPEPAQERHERLRRQPACANALVYAERCGDETGGEGDGTADVGPGAFRTRRVDRHRALDEARPEQRPAER
jgi:hypothetical protein